MVKQHLASPLLNAKQFFFFNSTKQLDSLLSVTQELLNLSSLIPSHIKRLKEIYRALLYAKWYAEGQQYEAECLKINPALTFKRKVEVLTNTLSNCGNYATKKFYCKKCEADNLKQHQANCYVESHIEKESLLKVVRSKFLCEIRYCANPECANSRFASLVENIKSIKDFKGLKTLWHFVIGFEPLTLSDFMDRFSEYKKSYEYVLNNYFKRLNKKGIEIKALRVLDFSFVKEGLVYPHFHFAAKPVNRNVRSRFMACMQQTRKEMQNSRSQKVRTSFHLQFFKHAKFSSIVSYLSIRSAGMYKYKDTKDFAYVPAKEGNLLKSIKEGKYFFLKDLISKEQYIRHFYNRRHYVTIGGLLYGSIITDNMSEELPKKCKYHGELARIDIRIEIEFDKPPSPPPNIPKIDHVWFESPIQKFAEWLQNKHENAITSH